MTTIAIDSSKCSGCTLCMTLCPYCIIEMKEGESIASVNPNGVQFCSKCGHCASICPEGAITVDFEGAGSIPDYVADSNPTFAQLSRLIAMRRSVRSYKKEPVPRETLEKILDIIRYAPTGMNGQSVRWLIISNPKEVQNLVAGVIEWARQLVKSGAEHPLMPILPMIINAWDHWEDHICHGAPHLVIAYAHKDNPVGFIDATIALTHLDIVAPTLDLGTCWAGIVQIACLSSPDLMASLGLPPDHVSIYGMMIGYPKYKFHQIPKRNALQVIWK